MLSLFFATLAIANGVPVPPDTPSLPPPPPPPARPTHPPECVDKILSALFEREKIYYENKKAYSDSMLEIRGLSAIGIGCPGWTLPEVKLTYGGTGFTASMEDAAKGYKWIINQDKALILEEREIKALVNPNAR